MFKKHPKGILTVFLVEMWERFGFYIMSAVYVLYMDKVLEFDDSTKGNLYALFLGAAYLFPILGGWLGDKILGQIKTIRIGAWMMLVGYVLLALSGKSAMLLFYIGLFMVAAGTGIFKVNMSVTVGNLYKDRIELKDAGFNIYYMGVNVGATIGPLAANIIGMITENYNLSFAAAGVGMFFALGSLEIGKKLLSNTDRFHADTIQSNENVEKKIEGKEFWERVVTLIVLFIIASFFWLPFYQNSFALTLFADRSTTIIEWLRPESYVTFNALFIILLTPPMLALFSRMRRVDKEPSTPVKIFLGLLIMGLAMFVMVWAGLAGGDGDINIMSPMWLISTYFLITIAEIMISPMGQSYVSKVAPPQIQGLMMGGWFGATALGAMSSGIFGKFYSDMAHHQYFLLLGVLSVFAAMLVLIFMKKLKKFAD
ncbi:MAG: peptide MFS transporter [Calditrichaceae bacterium]